MRVSINEKEFERLREVFTEFGWQTYGGKNAQISACKKVSELGDVVWMEIDVERLERGESIEKVLAESVNDFRAVWGACRVAIQKDTSIKDLNESDAIIKLYEYINKMVDLKQEMNEILKKVKERKIKLV